MELPKMEIDRRERKHRAREAMGAASPPFWLVTLVYVLMTTGVNLVVHLVTTMTTDPASGFSQTGFFLSLLTVMYRLVVAFGFQLWCLWTVRRLSPGLGSLIQGFSVWGRVLWMEILIYLRVFLTCFVLLFAILFLAAALFPNLLYQLYSPLLLANLLTVPVSLLIWVLMLRYSLAPYLLADRPDDGASAAVRRSTELMRGWTWELFKLEFSFLGWMAVNFVLSFLVQLYFLWSGGLFQLIQSSDWLAVLSLLDSVTSSGLVYAITALVTLPMTLWLAPYRGVARAGFYHERLALQQRNAPPLI